MGTVRMTLALAAAAAVTPPMMLYQAVAMRTGLLDERRAPRAWHRLVTKLLGLRIHVHGRLAAQRPLLIVANHISWTDIMVLGSLAEVHFIAKSEVAGWPLMGTFARMQRSVFVERGERRSAGKQAGEVAARLSGGDPMVLFAEGTTGDGNAMLPFKSTLFGAAHMALQAAGEGGTVAIQPVAIAYTRLHGLPMGRRMRSRAAWIGDQDLVPHLLALLRDGAIELEVHFGEPVEFSAGTNRKEVAREVERRVREMMAAALRDPR